MAKHEQIRDHYRRLIQPGRENFEILDWAAESTQKLRFAVLAGQVDLHRRRLLDVGCGLGDLLEFLADDLDLDYTGLDITPELLDLARRNHPAARFVQGDLFGEDPPLTGEHFDVVFCSGTLNLNLGNNMAFLGRAFDRMLGVTAPAGQTVVNLLNDRLDNTDDRYFHYNLPAVLEIVQPMCSDVRVIDDYLPNDFTLVCTPRRAG
jgi:SAM-dependent methyltransferase